MNEPAESNEQGPLSGAEEDQSATIGALAGALAKAQGAFKTAPKTSTNPFYGSKYADLAAVMSVVRDPLAANGLAVSQRLTNSLDGVIITTMLMHASGEWIRDRLAVRVEPNMSKDGKRQAWIQALGSTVTYARRYALSSILGVAADEDDDGNSAAEEAPPRPPPVARAPVDQASLVGKVRFGKKTGVPLAELDDGSLTWYENKIAGSDKPVDVAMRNDIQAERERRGVQQQ